MITRFLAHFIDREEEKCSEEFVEKPVRMTIKSLALGLFEGFIDCMFWVGLLIWLAGFFAKGNNADEE